MSVAFCLQKGVIHTINYLHIENNMKTNRR